MNGQEKERTVVSFHFMKLELCVPILVRDESDAHCELQFVQKSISSLFACEVHFDFPTFFSGEREDSNKSTMVDVWDKYELIEKVGQGTFGKVFKAREKATGQMVALKKTRMRLMGAGI